MAMLFIFIDKLYLVGAAEADTPGIGLPSDFIEETFDLQKLVVVALILTWCSIASVKFSYLFLFKKLIGRLPPMIIYWWFVAAFNAIISAYGTAVYIAACPDFYSFKSSGIHTGRTFKSIDTVWQTYWQFIAANLALTMTAATAFRTFFVSRAQERRPVSPGSNNTWYTKSKKLLRSTLSHRLWRSKSSAAHFTSGNTSKSTGPFKLEPQIPGGTMTGIRTLISGQGKTKGHPSQVMHGVIDGEYDDSWPLHHLPTNGEDVRAINVQRDVTLVSED
ncbi:MAG: hypothetical protein Q9175_005537, partial [Cornicularia normoerica]